MLDYFQESLPLQLLGNTRPKVLANADGLNVSIYSADRYAESGLV